MTALFVRIGGIRLSELIVECRRCVRGVLLRLCSALCGMHDSSVHYLPPQQLCCLAPRDYTKGVARFNLLLLLRASRLREDGRATDFTFCLFSCNAVVLVRRVNEI